jgi:chemotaxis protein MotD
MSEICLPNTDVAASAVAESAPGRTSTAVKTASMRKAAHEGSRAFRDLLGAMAQRGKADGRAAGERAGASPQSRPAAQLPSAASPSWERESTRVILKAVDIAAAAVPAVGASATWRDELVAAPDMEKPEGCEERRNEGHPDAANNDVKSTSTTDIMAALVAAPASPRTADAPSPLLDLRAALSAVVERGAAERGPAASVSQQPASSGDPGSIVAEAPVEFRAAAPAKVSVVAQETHFVPPTVTNAVGQIADAVITDLPNLIDSPEMSVDSAAVKADARPDRTPMRMLTVQLDPPDLGEVTIKMRLKGDNLELRVAAANHDTARLLQTQRDALTDLMRDTGYQADVGDVQVADVRTVASSGNTSFGQSLDRSDSQQSSAAEHRQQNGADRGSAGRGDRPQRQQTASGGQEHAAPGSMPARSSAVYL